MRVSVVTGAASGIGRAIADALAADGHHVIGVDIAEPPTGLSAEYVRADLSTAEGAESVAAALGDRMVRDLVHCAAVGQWSAFRDTPRQEWQRILRTNLEGTIGLTQVLLPHLETGGRVVLFASGTVFKGPRNLSAYVASKAGVIGFARCLAEELGGHDITVNVVSPGITVTPMISEMAHTEEANIAGRAIKRRAWPEDIVGPVQFLLSDAAAFVTGQTICVDGGSVKH